MNCKPGDMAIVVASDWMDNRGIIVEVLHQHINTAFWDYGRRPAWWCRSSRLSTWYFKDRDLWVFDYEGPIPDDCLRPIRPPAPEEDEQESQPITERETALA